ncbi:putative uncharacterized protein DDB_G0282133 isoform X3 [Condylostylus longicornis]|uniref:putative uncharacterized protein DDB_G0282133 isoform X3 n=1 Tax=Condylostylus longicornis TaxID=2530218 RepID=UPI00244DE479|nr:putative uncharacterized protein DDB_G0282133 isoform X3 [Condylostylus longicornis]
MNFFTLFYGLSIVFGLCGALPIPSLEIGIAERNMFLIGAVAFLSFGAVLAGCVCCRRRKKGFEEFTNESGTLESNKTEYPIFRALSPETQSKANEVQSSEPVVIDTVSVQAASIQARGRREGSDQPPSAVVISIPVVNSSNERLITDDDNDNNNGPISPADLENIENNNAVDYIRNQNEIGIVIEPIVTTTYSRNRNLDVTSSSENVPEQIRIQNSQINNNSNNINNNYNNSINEDQHQSQQIKNISSNDIQIDIEEPVIVKNQVPLEYSSHINTLQNIKKHSNNKYYDENQTSAENNALQDFAISSIDLINDSFSTTTTISKRNSMPLNQTINETVVVESQTLYQNEILNSSSSEKINSNQNINSEKINTSLVLSSPLNSIKNTETNSSSSCYSSVISINNNNSHNNNDNNYNTDNNNSNNSNNGNSNNNNNNNNNKVLNNIQQIVQETVPISTFIDKPSKLVNHQNQHNQYHQNQYNNSDSGNNLDYKIIESTTENFNENKSKVYSKKKQDATEVELLNDELTDKNLLKKVSNETLTDLKEETYSIQSDCSEKSNETGSVEEALRALDIAIGDDPISENCSGEEDDNLDDKIAYNKNKQSDMNDDDSIPYENVIRDLLVTKNMGLNGLIIPKHFNTSKEIENDISTTITNNSENPVTQYDMQEKIKCEALELVESIIDQSRKIVEGQEREKIINTTQIIETPISKTEYIVNYALIKHQNPIIQMNGEVFVPDDEHEETYYENKKEGLNKKTEILNSYSPISNLKKLKSVESLECLFESEFLPSTSTPCITNKFQKKFGFEQTVEHNNGIKLFDCDARDLQTDNQNSMELLLNNSLDILNETNKISPITNATFNANATYNANDKTYNANATYVANDTYNVIEKNNETFELNNKTYDAIPNHLIKENDFTYPGDPCSSKQAIERDQYLKPLIKYQRDEVTSEELNTITPVNTPIELNYNQETWDKMTKSTEDADYPRSGWFLHPQEMISGHIGDENEIITRKESTFDVAPEDQEEEEEEEDAEKLELTFDMLRKQLAEVLPQPQGVVGPPDFSDEDDDQQGSNRTFDEYRSPLDGLIGLLENEIEPPSSVAPNEVFINYKRTLSPILEESETEETCKTFVMNETKCMDSTSTGCIETGEAIMGVSKALMASNDTLFNFEDTLGDKEDCAASPRLSSQSDSQATTPVKSHDNRSAASSLATTITTSSDTEKCGSDNRHLNSHGCNGINEYTIVIPDRRTPPKTLAFATDSQYDANKPDAGGDFCSPVEQKTFSDGTTSTSTDRVSSDISPTLDNETTFTMNTIDDKTCVTVIIKDDERISEISEPEWGSTASFNICETNNIQPGDGADTIACDLNSLTDVPSLDFNVNSFDKEFEAINNITTENSPSDETSSDALDQNKPIVIEALQGPLIIINAPNDKTSLDDETTTESSNCLDDLNNQEEVTNRIDSGHDDSGHSTQLSLDDKSNNTSHNISAQETDSIGDSPHSPQQQQHNLQHKQHQLQQEPLYEEQYPVINTDLTSKNNCKEFLQKEIEFSLSSQNLEYKQNCSIETQILENGFVDAITLSSSHSDDDIFHLEYSKENSDPNIKKYVYNDPNSGTNSTDHLNHQNNHHIHTDRTKDKFIANGVASSGIGVYANKVQISNGHQDTVIKMDKHIDISEHETTNNVYHNCNELTSSIILPSKQKDDELLVAEDVINHLSGEEDPWVETLHDIRFTGPGSADMLSTSFTTASNSTSEWDSDVDDSHSSEEFMYVRGPSANAEILRYIKQEGYSNDDEKDSDLWISNNKQSKEKFKVGSADDDLVSEASSSEYEGEFVPSSWDSMAQPSRSALKSPDKNNSNLEKPQQNANEKKRRNVVFKKQRYHSVYEYPRENLSLSPAYSEPILSTHKEFYNFPEKNSLVEFDDGFIVSSSMRPFHGGSQFNACYTWPTDSDFSWSQVDDIDNYNTEQGLATYNEIKWTHPMSNINNQSRDIIDSPDKNEENQRPDSGVGESAEMLSDRQSLGELCHAKTKLRLPIEVLTTTPIFNQFSTTDDYINERNNQQKILITSSTVKPSYNCKNDDEPLTKFIPENIITTQKDVAEIMENKNKMNFSTFGKRNSNSINNDESLMGNTIINNDKQKRIAPKTILKYRQIKPAINIILIDDISGQQQQQQEQQFNYHQQQQEYTDNYCQENNSNSSSSNESNTNYFRNKILNVNNSERNNSNIVEINNDMVLKSEKIRQSDSTDEDSGIESIMKLNNKIESD